MPSMRSLPRMPSVSMPSIPVGWRSPRLFARREEDVGSDHAEASSSWTFNPSQWRFGSPTDFFRNEDNTIPDEDLAIAPAEDKSGSLASRFGWDPRQWRFPTSPKLFGDTGEDSEATASAHGTSPSSGSNWPMDPRQWRLSNQQLFGRSRSVDTAILDSSEAIEDSDAASPNSIWNLRPRSFLARRFGSFSLHGSSDPAQSEDGYSEDAGEESEESAEASSSSEGGEDEESDEEGNEQHELNLLGHR